MTRAGVGISGTTRGVTGTAAARPGRPGRPRVPRPPWRARETSATGTSHQDPLSGAGTSGSVSTWMSDRARADLRASASAASSSATSWPLDHLDCQARARWRPGPPAASRRPAGRSPDFCNGTQYRTAATRPTGQRADRGEAVVLHEHHGDLDLLLDGRDQLARPSSGTSRRRPARRPRGQGAAIFTPDAAGDLIPHAGVAVLDVVALRVPGPPELVQVARHRPGRAHHYVARARRPR